MIAVSEPPTTIDRREQPGMRERKKARTRQDLVAAALRLFARHGFDATTVDAIAAEADVHPRTFFRHFASKEDVVLTENRARLQRILDDFRSQPDEIAVLTALRRAHAANTNDYWHDREGLRQQVQLMTQEPALRARDLEAALHWQHQLAVEVGRRLGTDPVRDVRTRLLAGTCLTVLSVCSEAWLADPDNTEAPDLVNTAFTLLEQGLGG